MEQSKLWISLFAFSFFLVFVASQSWNLSFFSLFSIFFFTFFLFYFAFHAWWLIVSPFFFSLLSPSAHRTPGDWMCVE
jgi:hypothetical protein